MSITSFTNRLQQAIKKEKGSNFIYSPLGVTLCCGMAYIGAEGVTKTEMELVFGYNEKEQSLFPANVMKMLNDSAADSITFLTAQKVFLQKEFRVLPKYLKDLKQLEAEVGKIDSREPARSAKEINTWVRKVTKGEIKEIVSKEELRDENLLLMLISAVYFRGDWADKFELQNTKPQDFFLTDGTVVQVPMMNKFSCQSSIDYVNSKKLKAEIIKLPYKGKRFSLVVFIPNDKNDMSFIENVMLTTSVAEYLKELQDFQIELTRCVLNVGLPKFQFENEVDLMEPLKKLGMEDAFDIGEADFASITDDPSGLYISSFIQRAMIKVDETGTIAVAVSRASGKRTAKTRKVINVIADHPFYFQLIEVSTQIVLFSGLVTDPRPKS